MNWGSTILGGLPASDTDTAFRKESGVGFSKVLWVFYLLEEEYQWDDMWDHARQGDLYAAVY